MHWKSCEGSDCGRFSIRDDDVTGSSRVESDDDDDDAAAAAAGPGATQLQLQLRSAYFILFYFNVGGSKV